MQFENESLNEPIAVAGNQTRNRWEMARAGIFNFWVYDDEEISLEEGRLILRGTNGAGKSVTMQSFLPLVLDGDKRPQRLDPFGSRDRRIEYYLLGDDGKHIDRIGYLWMEFHHPQKGIYKTIGIGLRARRAASQVSFWGFLLDDGRRVNQDFWLYDRVAWLEGKGKYPLDRRELEARIGAGGQVVQEQKAYRDLVNKALFGFYDSEAFADLMNLIIQLRSPKLSKDFKPSAIYHILTEALPPLQEDDLRPLSEVLEDMDQIADRLDELKLHQSELEKLEESYDRYNRFLLYQASEEVLDAKAKADDVAKHVEEVQAQCIETERKLSDSHDRLQGFRVRLQEVDADLDVLNRHEAIEKQRELQALEGSFAEIGQYLDKSRARIKGLRQRHDRMQLEIMQNNGLMTEYLRAQEELLLELESLAREMEFAEHDVYHRYWHPHPPEDDRFVLEWKKDVARHREAVEYAWKIAQAEREAWNSLQELEKELGAIRQERDAAELAKVESEKQTEAALQQLKEEIVQWKHRVKGLAVEEKAFQQILQAVSAICITNRNYNSVKQPVIETAEEIRRQWREQEWQLRHDIQRIEEVRADLKREQQAWRESREPEPERSDARTAARVSRGAGEGAPLYAVCDFLGHWTEEERARIEGVLSACGLLDAWITPDGRIGRLEEGEEVWLAPAPVEWGYTLADVLKPVPSPESGLDEAMIDAVLRTFAWKEVDDTPQFEEVDTTSIWIGSTFFQFGPVRGCVTDTQPARYIGKEARRRFKLAEIERLQREIEACDQQLWELSRQVSEIQMAIAQVDEDVQAFPDDKLVQERLDALADAVHRLNAVMAHAQRMADRVREKNNLWQQLKIELAASTEQWSRLKSLRELQAARETIQFYLNGLSDLHAEWRQYRQTTQTLRRLQEEAEELLAEVENETELAEELEEKYHSLKVKVESLRRHMQELGIHDLYERISRLNEEKRELGRQIEKEDENIREAEKIQERLAERLETRKRQFDELQQAVERALQRWNGEISLGLVADWVDVSRSEWDDVEVFRLCKEIYQELQPSSAGRNRESVTTSLLDQFNAVRQLLMDYALEAVVDDKTGRVTVVSMRDRLRPQTPSTLLEEINALIIEHSGLLDEKDRQLYEEIILRSVGKTVRQRIMRAEQWIKEMNRLMAERNTSSGLKLQLQWVPKAAQSEKEMNAEQLVDLLRRDARLLREDEVERMIQHFRSRIQWAKQGAQEERESLRKHIYEILDYRTWFQFMLRYKKGGEAGYRELTDSRFNVMSGGEKAMSMYIPLFAATYSRYADASPEAPKIISLDEAFAGVDEENIRDLFKLLTEMDFDYMMTSQVLWGCYDTVPSLSVVEIYRPNDADFVTLFRYRWNGKRLELLPTDKAAAASEENGYGRTTDE
ncbi:TIGR02680 family protein [Brevibacillus sp. WF146]|uniref:TIGR02680 family protein n=1 Tax=Brevibacillus sp. WF146 TaxID=319501 RepID=UPI0007EDE923|nr:TIGR02680 family protein [Brevibacillus sp. WF146]UYZ14100.1 TIGR02680 family protein [Brevibacillus sp. WF146]